MKALVSSIGYTPFFICLSVLDILGAVVLWTLVRERQAGGFAVEKWR
jgi:ACS family hexuronate transporter-like MFS transporter